MRKKDIIVIGGSAGAIDVLKRLAQALPLNFAASLFAVVHASEGVYGYLADILGRESSLKATRVGNSMPIQPGHIYVSNPGLHLVLQDGFVRSVVGPRENRFRPSIDVLFRAAAEAHGPRVIGVLLSGYLDDGVSGLSAIKQRGGTTIVQDPQDAQAPALPENALENAEIDYCLPSATIPEVLMHLVGENVDQQIPPRRVEIMPSSSENPPSRFTCPECGGTLFEVTEGKVRRLRCRVGHAFSDWSLLSAQDDRVEDLLWAAQRALEERADIFSRLASRYQEKGGSALLRRYRSRANSSSRQAQRLRELLDSAGIDGAELEGD